MSELRLLAIGTDASLTQPNDRAIGDAHQRQLKYASILGRYDLVVRTQAGPAEPIRLAPTLLIHPTASRSRVTFPLDAARLGTRIAREAQPSLISTEDPFLCGLAGLAVARRVGLPLSLQFAGDMIDNPFWMAERPLNRWLNPLGKWLIRRAQTFRVVSSSEREKLVRLGVPAERIWNLGWITDFSRFLQADGSELRTHWLADEFERLVLFVGRLVPQKDLPTLLAAARLVTREHARVRFLIAGSGPLAQELCDRIGRVGLERQVAMIGPVAYEEVPRLMAAADVLALSSVYEGNARVLAEAGATGLPAVTTDVSGSRDTVADDETGFVVPVRDAAQLADRLCRLLADPDLAVSMGSRARDRVLSLYGERALLDRFRTFWELTANLR